MKMGWSLGSFGRMAVVVVGVGFVTSCASTVDYQRLRQQNENLQRSMEEFRAQQMGLDDEIQRLRAENERLRKLEGAEAELAAQKKRLQELMAEFDRRKTSGEMETPPGVEVINSPGLGGGFRISGSLLFPSGRAELTEEGKKTLASLLPMLRDRKGVRVVGHTDTDPIQHSDWGSNLELSAARALAVAEELKKIGIPYERMHVMGFGSSLPAGSGPRDKARDRRVEIFLIDD